MAGRHEVESGGVARRRDRRQALDLDEPRHGSIRRWRRGHGNVDRANIDPRQADAEGGGGIQLQVTPRCRGPIGHDRFDARGAGRHQGANHLPLDSHLEMRLGIPIDEPDAADVGMVAGAPHQFDLHPGGTRRTVDGHPNQVAILIEEGGSLIGPAGCDREQLSRLQPLRPCRPQPPAARRASSDAPVLTTIHRAHAKSLGKE